MKFHLINQQTNGQSPVRVVEKGALNENPTGRPF
jgi:hypothetical protein